MKAYTAAAATILLSTISSTAFAPSAPFFSKYTETRRSIQPSSTLQMAVSAPDITVRDEINAMHIKDIRKELESYGIDNKSFFEKKEMVDALLKARQEEMIPNYEEYEATIGSTDTTTTTSADTSFFANTKTASSSKKDKNWFQTLKDNVTEGVKGVARSERIKLEMAKLKDVKVKELKNELESYGFSTKSYFEKREFERAVAEARVDGVTKKYSSSAASGSDSSSSSRRNWADSTNNEDWDPSYKNVFVKRFDSSTIDPRGVIDIRAR